MDKLIAGYKKFREEVFPVERHRFKSLAQMQDPNALFITCADSRVMPAMLTQSEPGELFMCRVVGNLVPAHGAALGGVTSAIEYAVVALGVKHIVVCGHSDCGAMKAFMHPEKLDKLPAVQNWLQHAQAGIEVACHNHAHLTGDDFLEALTKENIIVQLQHLRTHPCVAARTRKGELSIHGWYYCIGTGEITVFTEDTHSFVPLAEMSPEPAEQLVLA